jgi:hypothetical protein
MVVRTGSQVDELLNLKREVLDENPQAASLENAMRLA